MGRKLLHDQYPLRANNNDADQEKTYQLFRSLGLQAETEGSILAAQDQTRLTKSYRAKVMKNLADQDTVYALKMRKPLTI